MDSASIIPSILMVAAAASALLIARYSWQWRKIPGEGYFVLLMTAVATFALANSFELAATGISTKILWAKLSYLGIVCLAPLWLLFCLEYGQRHGKLSRRQTMALWLIPLLTLGFVFTNEWHGLVWSRITPLSAQPGSRLIYDHGLVMWLHTAYAYTLMFLGTYVLAQTALRSNQLQRRQAAALLVGALLPWSGNVFYLLNINPWPGLDLTPLAFVLAGLFVAGSIHHFHILDLAPNARDILFNGVSDGVLVIDSQNRLVDINRVAQEWMGVDKDSIGQDVFDLLQLGHLDHLKSPQENVGQSHSQIEVGQGGDRHVYDLTISPLLNDRGRLQGRVALLHDITNERALLDVEQRRVRQMELLNAMTHVAISTLDLQSMLETLAAPLCELLDADGAYLELWNEARQRSSVGAAYGALRSRPPQTEIKPGERIVTESMLALPLIADDQTLGTAMIAFNGPHSFTKDEIALGEQAVDQIALALAKAQLYEAERRRNDQLTALQSISQAIASSLDLDQIFETVVHVVHNTFEYPYVSIFLLDGEMLHMKALAGYQIDPIYWEIPLSQGVLGRAARTRQTQYIRSVTDDPDFIRAAENVESEICVPLLREDTVLGTLNVESPADHPLVETDVILLTTFANQVAVAMENARLFRAERVQREMAEALREMGLALSESLNIETVLDRLLNEISRVAPYDSASVMLLDEDGSWAHITRLRGYERFGEPVRQETAALSFEIAATPNLRKMVETSQPLIITDTATDPDWIHIDPAAHVRSWAGAPIIARDQVIGFFSLDKTQPGFYLPEHADRLAAFAGQTAIAIENARLFTEIQRMAEKERLLFAATRDFTAGLNEDAVLHAIVNHMTNALDVDGCTVSQWDQLNNQVVTLLDYSRIPGVRQDQPGDSYPLDEYPATRWVLENCQPLLVQVDDPDTDPAEAALLKLFGNQMAMVLPLAAGREDPVFGIVELFRKSGTLPFSEKDLEMAQSFAAQAAAALENAHLHAQVRTMAMMDGLTGLANRRSFDQVLEQEVARAGRYGYSLGLIIIDIDSFKKYNDAYGHPAGDERLKAIARLLKDKIRESDLAARYGGEEFAIILPNTTKSGAVTLAERIRAAAEEVARVQALSGSETTILMEPAQAPAPGYTLSLGVAIYPEDGTSPKALLLVADNAEIAAKRAGKNRVWTAGTNGYNRED